MMHSVYETEEQQKLQKKHEESINNALSVLMREKDGRYFLNFLLEQTGVFKACYGHEDQTVFFEGRRSIGAELLIMLDNNGKNNLSKLFNREE